MATRGALVFDWVEYSVFGTMLGLSAFMGVYFGFIKSGGQDTVEGYLLGGKSMGIFLISMSLTASMISAISILGLPAEIYQYGSQYSLGNLCHFTVAFLCINIFLPVFYRLQSFSIYEYMEVRFDKRVRKLLSFLYTFSLFAYLPVVIYAPALALNQVSGMNVHSMSFLLCVICIFYTSFGGLKAVVWADTIQWFIMILASVFVAVVGTLRVGGLTAVYEAVQEGDRLEFFNFDLDPTERVTVWTVMLGLTVSWTCGSSLNPSTIQRFVSLNSISKAKKTVYIYTIGCTVLWGISAYMGLVVYTKYKGCDPLTSGSIRRPDQILPYFILDVLGDIPGLPGLFLAGVVCAALSTMSTGLNTVAGTLYEDFIMPMFGKMSDFKASLIMKLIVVAFGGVCLGIIMVIEKLGNIVTLSNALNGLTVGSVVGIFVLGLFFPPANGTGAMIGGLANVVIMCWIVMGNQSAFARGDIVYPMKPVSVDQCSFNVSQPHITKRLGDGSDDVFPLFKISVFLYTPLGLLLTVLIGLTASYLSVPSRHVDARYLAPVLRRFYTPVANQEKGITQEKDTQIVKLQVKD